MKDSEVLSVTNKADTNSVTIKTPKGEIEIESEIILSAVGIETNIDNLGLSDVGVLIERGKIVVDSHYKTSVDSIFAIGDIIGTPALAHVASAEALACVEQLAGQTRKAINYDAIPSCIYT